MTATDPAESPIRADHLTRITPEKSRQMQERRRALKIERELNEERARIKRELQPEAEPAQPKPDPYLDKQITRARKQLDRLYSMLAEEMDPQKIDRLASAISRLSEIERQLADRPLPGSKRPSMDKPVKQSLLDSGPPPAPAEGKIEQE